MDRLDEEFALLAKYFAGAEIDEAKRWVRIPNYKLPSGVGWNKETIDLAVEIRVGFPGTSPYGIYVPQDLRCNDQQPKSWQSPAGNVPSFPGAWAMISWTPEGTWQPSSDVEKGSNLLNFVLSFKDRFKDNND